jgi:hypothetical protein
MTNKQEAVSALARFCLRVADLDADQQNVDNEQTAQGIAAPEQL